MVLISTVCRIGHLASNKHYDPKNNLHFPVMEKSDAFKATLGVFFLPGNVNFKTFLQFIDIFFRLFSASVNEYMKVTFYNQTR